MKPAPFEYLAPDSLEETLSILQEHGSDAKLLAGGQSLVPMMNFRLARPRILVDLNKLIDMDYVLQDDESSLRIGAMTRQTRLEKDPLIARTAPIVSETMSYVAHPQIRNRGTLGGSLAHADPAAELPAITLALGARFYLRSAAGERWISAEDFFQGLFTTVLTPEEILVEVELPAIPSSTGWSFMEVARRRGDYAMMGVASLLTLDEQNICRNAQLVYLGAGGGPVDARQAAMLLHGEVIGEAAIEAAATMASEHEIDPWGSVHATPSYQRHLAYILTKRALKQAWERAARPVP